ncbi:MAG: SGNH/GDSL hydrolase family protein [Verrucomicrobiota bacterium]
MNGKQVIRLAIVFWVLGLATGKLAAGEGTSGAEAKQGKTERKVNPAMTPVEDVEGLPRVLLIGDSISIGYTIPVREKLAGKANVHRPLTNCGPTTKGVEAVDEWLGEGTWDVIHFNWGLHDLKYMGPNGENLAEPGAEGSQQQVAPAEYEANLRKLVERLKETGAVLIWRNTTPVPEGAKGRVAGDSAKYNAIAAGIMEGHGIVTNDLFTVSEGLEEGMQLPANVHYSKEGSDALADSVVASILEGLGKKRDQ